MISNCLFEALKAKLKNPKEVVIHRIPAKFLGSIFPHFWWSVGDEAYDFKSCKASRKFQVLLFKGEVRSEDLVTFEAFVAHKVRAYTEKLESKYKVADYVAGSGTVITDGWKCLSDAPEVGRKITVAVAKNQNDVEMHYINSEDAGNFPGYAYWRYEDQLQSNLEIDFD